MTAIVKDGQLIITIPFDSNGKPSSSGKSKVHASTQGNVTTDVMINDKPLVIGLNAYVKS